MPRSTNQKLKILYLMKIMLERTDNEHGLTISEIIEALERYNVMAERKSIYDDMEALRLFGIDVETRRGKTVTYYVASRDFELPELKLLVDAVQSSKFITHKKSAQLIKKIEGLTSAFEAQQLQHQVFVTNRIKTMNESIYYTVDYIHAAINSNSKIKFQYFEWNDKKEKEVRHGGKFYVVSPWALAWDNDNYYMVAYEAQSKKIKHFRADKLLNISVLDERRESPEEFDNFDVAVYCKKTFGMFGGEDELVTLRCKSNLAGVIIDRFGQDVTLCRTDGGFFEVTVRVAVSPLFLTWLINFGTDVKILSPDNVIDRLIQTAQTAIEQYKIN